MSDSNWMYQPSSRASGNDGSERPSPESGNGQAPNLSALRDPGSPSDGNKTAGSTPHSRIRRRNRVITSCLECRRRKLKCDKLGPPCTNCTRFKRDCLYLAPSLDPQSQQKLADIKERMGALEKNLEREVAAKTAKPHVGGAVVSRSETGESTHAHVEGDDEDDLGDDEEALEATPLAALDSVYEDNADDDLMDLGVQLGKMRISERIGGWIRPKLVDELNDTLRDVMGGKSRWSTSPQSNDHRSLKPGNDKREVRALQASPKSYIGPGPDYIAPSSSFFFPGINMGTTLIDYLPSKQAADQLIAQYFNAVHNMCRAFHRPTFEAQYTVFWGHIATGSEPLPQVQAIVFATMFSAAVSMNDTQVARQFGTTKPALIDSLRSGTEMALSKANFLRTTKLDVMQAFVMYLIPLVRAEVSRAHSALVGMAIRLAECMGLHRDGTHYSMSAVEVHIRRLIWHQLCFLDMRTCEATGPRPQIRPGDYDTRCPLNVNDSDFGDPNDPPKEDKPYWTDMTLTRIRCEFIELRRSLWFDVVQIDKKKKSLTSTVVKIQKTKNALDETYRPMLNDDIPIQLLAGHLLTMATHGCFIQVLHRYLFSTTTRMPDRLRQILIEAGLTQMEHSVQLETDPRLAPWAWYRGAFNQYHGALLLLVEVYAYPMRKEAPRIWKCLDYIFDIPSHLSPKQKAEVVITDLRDRMEVYHQMRKMRSTNELEQRISSLNPSTDMGWNVGDQANATGGSARAPTTNMNSFSALPPDAYSPPPAVNTDSNSGDSRKGSVAPGGGDMNMEMMDDIDWAEWDRYFPIEQNNGDLNIPDFDFTDFTGGLSNPPMDLSTFATAASTTVGGGGLANPPPEDLSDVNFTPAYFSTVTSEQQLKLYPTHYPSGR